VLERLRQRVEWILTPKNQIAVGGTHPDAVKMRKKLERPRWRRWLPL
jgi:hypothetical protein